jgi:hypothetical protein
LKYFEYLSYYRFRFLPISAKDIENAVFGEGNIKTIRPENIRKLNFSLTLSSEYGVAFKTAIEVIYLFLHKVITDTTVTSNIVEIIFAEILDTLPIEWNKWNIGSILIEKCMKTIKNEIPTLLNKNQYTLMVEKINKLICILDIYNYKLKTIN